MIKRLFLIAAITSPILAMYVVGPLYLFSPFPEFNLEQLFLGLTLEIFIFWTTNITILHKFPNWSKPKIYLGSAVIAFILTLPKVLFHPPMPFQNMMDKYFIYPVMTIVLVNSIIWIIINSVAGNFKMRAIEVKVEQLNVKNLEAQKQMLLQQLQPHFLFNALSTLKSLIDENPSLATDYTVRLSDFLRYSVQAKDNEVISLAEELKFTKDYIELQKVRFGDSLACKIEVSETFLTKKVPVYALQTLVENAIKHNAFSDKKPLTIHITTEENKLKVVNNRLAKRLNSPSGTGLQNLNQRYMMIADTEIQIEETDANFIVTLTLI
jgi:two-component system, LytTR family, sensor kinase